MLSPEFQFANAKKTFDRHSSHRLADEPLEFWVLPSDRHLPSGLIGLSLREVLSTPYSRLSQTRGVGNSKLQKLVSLVQRAIDHLEETEDDTFNSPSSTTDTPASQKGDEVALSGRIDSRELAVSSETSWLSSSEIDEKSWARISECIKRHSLDHHPLGRFAESLAELPKGLWAEPVITFISKPLFEVRQLPGYGEQRIATVIDVIKGLASFVVNSPTDKHLQQQVYPASINRITNWINKILYQDEVPDYLSLCQYFVLPLLRQLEVDLGSQVAEIIERRLGADGMPETLQQVAEHFDLTRERIRQLTLRAPLVMEVRWPEGKHLLDDFYEKIRFSGKATGHVELIQRTLEMLFDFETSSGATNETVVEAWETAGRRKETPMSESEILSWVGGCFPRLLPETGLKWIAMESSVCKFNGRTLYFSNDEQDRLLHQLYSSGVATTVADLVDVDEKEERNLRNRLLRDLRFTEDEDHYMLPTEMYGFVRDSIGWHADLFAAEGFEYPSRTSISVESIATLATGGLLHLGIADVTVWGFHRFINEQLANLFQASLPSKITPFVLADMVVRQTGGRIRPMRRRRLRWDRAGHHLPARGKRGWIGHVVEKHGVAIVLDELGGLLNSYYQDYAPYVLEQLDLESTEDGEMSCGAMLVQGVSHRVPQMLLPTTWVFNPIKENVSDEVKLAVARAIGYLRDGSIAKKDLEHIPWFGQLLEHHSYGENIWEPPKRDAPEAVNVEPNSGNSRPIVVAQSPVAHSADEKNTKNVDDLLSKFL